MRRGVSGGVSVCSRRGERGVLRVGTWRGRSENCRWGGQLVWQTSELEREGLDYPKKKKMCIKHTYSLWTILYIIRHIHTYIQ